MAQQSQVANPFLLMLQPEVVLAAVEKSERLGRLNRHLCRPLDRVVGPAAAPETEAESGMDEDLSDVLIQSHEAALS